MFAIIAFLFVLGPTFAVAQEEDTSGTLTVASANPQFSQPIVYSRVDLKILLKRINAERQAQTPPLPDYTPETYLVEVVLPSLNQSFAKQASALEIEEGEEQHAVPACESHANKPTEDRDKYPSETALLDAYCRGSVRALTTPREREEAKQSGQLPVGR